jgi:muramoyltetrapeptide carboxypeptidase LdcA involved in peptidoglycan recycling
VNDVWGYLAGTDANRSADINALYNTPSSSVQAMIANRGGFGCTRLLDSIDFQAVVNNPKIVMGYRSACLFFFLLSGFFFVLSQCFTVLEFRFVSPCLFLVVFS